jgi:hypothetical protein
MRMFLTDRFRKLFQHRDRPRLRTTFVQQAFRNVLTSRFGPRDCSCFVPESGRISLCIRLIVFNPIGTLDNQHYREFRHGWSESIPLVPAPPDSHN